MAPLYFLTIGCALLLLVLGIDDLLVDCLAHGRRFYRRVTIYRKHRRLSLDDLQSVREQRIAIMIPAWSESAVLGRMIETTLARYDYKSYQLFIGIYENDPETRSVAASIKDPRITICTVPRPGPTNKADCLNAIHAGILARESETGEHYEIFLLHDAEDVVHPLELRLMNYLIPRKDMVQLPVIPIARTLSDFTSGHYMDEFAEAHGKDLLVREWLTESVPSAGVGCAFSRRAINMVAATRDGQPFNKSSLTEDYDFALELRYFGLKQIFVRFRIDGELVATQEYFPNHLAAACRQKSRWLIGITFQSLAATGWRGSWPLKYALYRDRKGVLTAFVGMLSYGHAILWIGLGIFSDTSPPMGANMTLAVLLTVNAVLLFNRSLQRAAFVGRIYGWKHAVMSVPRQFWGNVINFLAACRAIRLFLRHRRTGKPLGWDKTDHHFPDNTLP